MELREAPPPPPDVADRRVLDAQVLYSLKNYEEAATILLDVVEKYPNTRAHDDALLLARRIAVPGARLLFGAPLPAGGGRQEHGIEARAAGAAAAGRDLAAHGRLRARRCVPGPPAEPAAAT